MPHKTCRGGQEAPTLRIHEPSRAYFRDLQQRLTALDVPDCGCDPDDGECAHLVTFMAGVDVDQFPLTLPEWTELLLLSDPLAYIEPPPPPPPARHERVLSREARVELMAARQAAGVGLRHPSDLWLVDHDGKPALKAERGRNGAARDAGVIAARGSA